MPQGQHSKYAWRLRTAFLGLCLLALGSTAAVALVSFDFETPYLVHPAQQVWDFCLVRDAGRYHAFYHSIPQQAGHPANADTIWHAVSDDLRRWDILGPALTSGQGWWDETAMWAPDVVYDDQTGRWAMLYTGIGAGMVQRACLAWSDDLETWEKSTANPVFEPDSVTYFWAPSENWSSFRDPFLYHDGQQWNMLTTAHLRLGGVPGYRRGIVHRAVSADLENWTDAGVFFEHDGNSGKTNALESVQYLVREGWHHLFFVEQDPTIEHHPTTHLVAADPAGWTMAGKTIIDAGWAPEIEPFLTGGDTEIYARLAKDQDPRDDTWFVTAKFDNIRFDPGGVAPQIIPTDPLGPDWPTRTGAAGAAAPTFGDNPVWRGDPDLLIEGHGAITTAEFYGGPLGGVGGPGAALGDTATGRLESRPFMVTGDYFRLLLAGGNHPSSCHVALLDDSTDDVLATISPAAETVLTERFWDVRAFQGLTVRLAIVDEETDTDGWIGIDSVEEFSGPSAVEPGPLPQAVPVTRPAARPNPFNAGTEIRFEVEIPGRIRLDIFDLAGRRVWSSPEAEYDPGEIRVSWNARDAAGRHLPGGVYLCRVIHDGVAAARGRLTLVK